MNPQEKTTPPDWCRQAIPTSRDMGGHGYRSGEAFDGQAMAIEAWGVAADGEHSGLLAFPYLWRRFGPPWWDSDPDKDLCRYVLGTPSDSIFLDLCPRGSPLIYGVGYLATREFHGAMERSRPDYGHRRPHLSRWREIEGPVGDLNRAIFAAMQELLRPVFIRDVAINLLGRCDEGWEQEPEPSKYAGLGVSANAMEVALAARLICKDLRTMCDDLGEDNR